MQHHHLWCLAHSVADNTAQSAADGDATVDPLDWYDYKRCGKPCFNWWQGLQCPFGLFFAEGSAKQKLDHYTAYCSGCALTGCSQKGTVTGKVDHI